MITIVIRATARYDRLIFQNMFHSTFGKNKFKTKIDAGCTHQLPTYSEEVKNIP